MKQSIQELLEVAVDELRSLGKLPTDVAVEVQVERARDPRHGEFASNLALSLARALQRKPRELAEAICTALPSSERVARVEIAGPGFINFFLTPGAFQAVVGEILTAGERYGCSARGAGRRVQVEFVSANPTGPLHVGHGRGAAYGATVASLLEAMGLEVHREYYVNDAGRQMDILATSVWLRYLELCGEEPPFPSAGYQGDYVWDIAATLHREHGDTYRYPAREVGQGLPPDDDDRELHVDALIHRCKRLLGDNRYRYVLELALNTIVDSIRDDLGSFGVRYDQWYSERSLVERGAVNRAIERLRAGGHVYERDGALWFRSSAYGDEKDRVVVRENGETTYFASDIAYHMDKLERGFDRVIDVWGADHHGYVPRLRGALRALGDDPSRLDVLLVQFASLYRNGERVDMSTRKGQFVTLRELCREVGNDAARFFYVMRRCEQHLDFDLDLAKAQSADNPVYYIQYAHARICSVMRQLAEKGLRHDPQSGARNLHLLVEAQERALLVALSRYPELVDLAARALEPHQLAHYLRDLANQLHVYYNAHQFLVDEPHLRDARLNLILATRQVIANGLALLGAAAPEQM